MAGYSGTPLFQKLGIKPGARLLVMGAPPGVMDSIREAPFPIEADLSPKGTYDVVVYFATSFETLERRHLELIDALDEAGGLWIAWPKRASKVPTDIDENRLRELFLPSTPMVDNKVCAIDEVWSGLRFVRRKSLR